MLERAVAAGEQRELPRMALRGKKRRPVEDRFALHFPALATRINAWLTRVTLRLPRRWRVRQLLIEYAAWRAYNARGRNDLDVLRTFNHADVVWDLSRALIGEQQLYHGRDGVVRYNEQWSNEWREADVDLAEIEEVKPNVFFVHLRQRGTGRVSGAAMEMDLFQVLQLRSGLVWRGTFYPSRTEAIGAATEVD
jgi:ketosteroid isomerase-like protein